MKVWRTGHQCGSTHVRESEKDISMARPFQGATGATDSPSPQHLAPEQHTSVSLEAEVPEALFDGMREFIRNHPHWDQYSVITSALAGFLFQNGSCDRSVKDHYLEGLFSES